MATYVNNLRLKEIATGAESGTWGTSTNTNLELIADAFGSGTEAITTNADTHTTTIADGSADEGRAIYMKYTGTLDSTCTITLAPNTVNKFWIIENATSGSQDIAISQGSGANVTIGNGKVMAIFTDGAGSGAAVLDALTDLVVTDSLQVAGPTLTVGDAAAEDTKLLFDGNAKDFYVGLDDSADKLVIGEGSAVGTNSILTMTDDTITVGDGAAVDTSIVYDGNAKDFYIGLDDSADKLVIGEGSTVGTNNILTITDDTVTIGDAAATDTAIVFDGNAQDFYIGLDDSVDDLVIGLGSTVGTTPAITIDEDQKLVFPAAHVTIGDGTAEDTALIYNGNAQDFYIGLDDSADDLIIGLGSTVGSTAIISMTEDQHISVQATKRIYLDGLGNTYIRESASDTIMFTTGGTDRWKIDDAGNLKSVADGSYDFGADGNGRSRNVYLTSKVMINEVENAQMTTGLTINQGSADNEIISLKSSDVNQPATGRAEADTYTRFFKASGVGGGLQVESYTDTDGNAGNAIVLAGVLGEAADTTKSTLGLGVVNLSPRVTDGSTGITTVGSNGNLVVITNNETTRFIFDAEGSGHADVEWVAFDKHNDLALLEDLETHLTSGNVVRQFGQVIKYDRQFFEDEGLFHDIRDVGDGKMRGMMNYTRMTMLHSGAIRQVGGRQLALEECLRGLVEANPNLEGRDTVLALLEAN